MVSGSRAKSTWLTGSAGLLMLAAAFVMMVCAAPRIHAAGHDSVTRDRLVSRVWATPDHWGWVTPGSNDGLTRAVRARLP